MEKIGAKLEDAYMRREIEYKDRGILNALLSALYRLNNRFVRKVIRKFIRRQSGGLYSKTLRELLSKYHGVQIGMYSMILEDHYAELPKGTTVGRYCSLAEGLVVLTGSHPPRHKSTHAFFYNPMLGYVDKVGIKRRTSLTIGHDVFIGSNVMILPNVTSIGTGSVIAARSVVIKDVPPFTIVGGNPAKFIAYRFSEDTIQKIMASKWWEKDIEELYASDSEFETFLRTLEEGQKQSE
jgi:virginiamycin A acetyltransferase